MSDWEQCDVCDHTYRYIGNNQCSGEPIPCKSCCTDSFGEFVYTPMYVIPEMAL